MIIGMFLYARIVMENLFSQTRLSALHREMDPGTFPRGIEKAYVPSFCIYWLTQQANALKYRYNRVAVRVFNLIPGQREDAKKLLGWIVCAKRPLRWREIQALFCIDPIKGNVDYTGERLRVTSKELCGALVDVHLVPGQTPERDEIVNIVHRTARE